MGFVVFLLLFGAVCFFGFIILAIGGLLFGGEDPYERELLAEERHMELCDTIEERKAERHLHITDARQVHLHQHKNP